MEEKNQNVENRTLTCIGCPMGCQVQVSMRGTDILSITGNTCPRGESYARKEVTAPTRIVTSTVCVRGGIRPVVSVKTACDIPKEKIFQCMEEIQKLNVQAPVQLGEILLKNVADTGVSVVATANVKKCCHIA